MTFTHKKRPYRAMCVRWVVDNTAAIITILEGGGNEVSLYAEHLMIRWKVPSPRAIDTLKLGEWLRVGENGVVKMMTNEEFELKYEEIQP